MLWLADRQGERLECARWAVVLQQLAEFLEPTSSYLSVVELGLYESTVRLNATLEEKGIAPGSPEWEKETEQVLEQQRTAMKPRLWPEVPARRYC